MFYGTAANKYIYQDQKHLQFLNCCDLTLQSQDKEYWLREVAKDGRLLAKAPLNCKHDRDIALAAVTKNGIALRYASLEKQNNKDIVLAAVTKDGLALQYASSNLLFND